MANKKNENKEIQMEEVKEKKSYNRRTAKELREEVESQIENLEKKILEYQARVETLKAKKEVLIAKEQKEIQVMADKEKADLVAGLSLEDLKALVAKAQG